jgi:ABC-type nitrate/sulfonate/bicarbonate transport system substrate-binding protein
MRTVTSTPRRPWRVGLALVGSVALLATGCGGGSSDLAAVKTTTSGKLESMTKATLVLDFVPNAVHAGIYRALAAGYYRDANIDLKVIQPTSTSDTLRLIDAGKADFGIADAIDVATQIDKNRPAKAFLALVQRPLGGLITLKKFGIDNPAQFKDKTIGVTGVPSDEAILQTVLAHGGLTTKDVKTVTIGFNGVQNLESGKVQGFIGFYPADGVQVQVDGFPVKSFPFDENGGPRYPGLVVFSTENRMADAAPLMRAFTAATVKGYDDTLTDPQRSLNDLLAANKTLKRKLTAAQLDVYETLFKAGAPRYGELNIKQVDDMLRFAKEQGIVKTDIAAERFGTNEYLP